MTKRIITDEYVDGPNSDRIYRMDEINEFLTKEKSGLFAELLHGQSHRHTVIGPDGEIFVRAQKFEQFVHKDTDATRVGSIIVLDK